MKPRIAAAVRCGTQLQSLHASVGGLLRDAHQWSDVVVLTDATTPKRAVHWIAEFASARGVDHIHVDAAEGGKVRNAAFERTTAEFVAIVDSGDVVDGGFEQATMAAVDRVPSPDLIGVPVVWLGPGATRVIEAPATKLEPLTENPFTVCASAIISRDAWRALGGFDETLAILDDYEFWLRALSLGRLAVCLDRPMVKRSKGHRHIYRQAWTNPRFADAIRAIVLKHADVFRRDTAAVLCARQHDLHQLRLRNSRLIERREAALSEIAALEARGIARLPTSDESPTSLDFGDFRRTTPISRDWGYERGTPVDRHYIEEFLDRHAPDIRGIVLEVQEADYTRRFGGDRVIRSDVVDLDVTNPLATILSDMRCAANVASNTYDCVILTQTLHVIDDMPAVIRECERILKPGGVLLATLPSASRVCLEYGQDGDFWRITEAGARRVFGSVFPSDALRVAAHGNVLVNAAFLYGLGCEELAPAEFQAADPYFPLVVTVRAQKVGAHPPARPVSSAGDHRNAAILMYHRVAEPSLDVYGLAVSPPAFRHQLEVLRDRYRPMPLDELAEAARNGDVPPGAVALTFDDGYVDNLTHASPLLVEFGVPATFFLTTGGLESGRDYEYWWDVLERSLLTADDRRPAALTIDLPAGTRTFDTSEEAARTAAHKAIYEQIVAAKTSVRDAVVDAVRAWSGIEGTVLTRRMRGAEMVALACRPGHAIGAHSVQHLMLPRQTPDVEADEIAGSRRTLETLLGRPVRAFAYPFGACEGSTVRAAHAANVDIAVTCEQAPLTERSNRLRLPRLDVVNRGHLRFEDWLAIHLTAVIPR